MAHVDDPLDALAARSDARLDALFGAIESAHLEEASLGDAWLDRRGADVLSHLHAWLLLLEDWCAADRRGESPEMPAPGYTWERLAELNDAIFEQYRDRGYAEIKSLLLASHAAAIATLRTYPAERLTDPKAFSWLDGTLVHLADECLATHYQWGLDRVAAALDASGSGPR